MADTGRDVPVHSTKTYGGTGSTEQSFLNQVLEKSNDHTFTLTASPSKELPMAAGWEIGFQSRTADRLDRKKSFAADKNRRSVLTFSTK